jgi:hypothetical protein
MNRGRMREMTLSRVCGVAPMRIRPWVPEASSLAREVSESMPLRTS